MLSSKNRFHGHGSLRYVYKNGSTVRSHVLTLKYVKNLRRSEPRVTVVISKKIIKRAVGRNRARRRIYEIVRRELPKLQPNYDIALLIFSAEAATMPHEELEKTVKQLLSTARIYKNEP